MESQKQTKSMESTYHIQNNVRETELRQWREEHSQEVLEKVIRSYVEGQINDLLCEEALNFYDVVLEREQSPELRERTCRRRELVEKIYWYKVDSPQL